MNPTIEFFGGPLDGEVREVRELLPLFTIEIRSPVPFVGPDGEQVPEPAPRIHVYRPASIWRGGEPMAYRWDGQQ